MEALSAASDQAMTEQERRVLEERFHALFYREVGFEHFRAKPEAWRVVPEKIYVAQSGRFVLLGFHEESQATQFWNFAMKAAGNPGT